jgi:hypothetical protein
MDFNVQRAAPPLEEDDRSGLPSGEVELLRLQGKITIFTGFDAKSKG